MTDIERREIFAHRADRKLGGEDVMSYTGFKIALADAERRFIESFRPAADQTESVRPEVVLPMIKPLRKLNDSEYTERKTWNNCLDEIRRLNPGINFIKSK